jgi:hypothetical protein
LAASHGKGGDKNTCTRQKKKGKREKRQKERKKRKQKKRNRRKSGSSGRGRTHLTAAVVLSTTSATTAGVATAAGPQPKSPADLKPPPTRIAEDNDRSPSQYLQQLHRPLETSPRRPEPPLEPATAVAGVAFRSRKLNEPIDARYPPPNRFLTSPTHV